MKLMILSKTRCKEASLDDSKPIVIANHLMKVAEKAVKIKLESIYSELLGSKSYQSGFQAGLSTQKNLAFLLNKISGSRRKTTLRKFFVSLDLKKAFDSVNRKKLFKIFLDRAKTPAEAHITKIIIIMFQENFF